MKRFLSVLLALFVSVTVFSQTLLVKKFTDITASSYTTGTAIVPGDFCCGTLANGTYDFASGRPAGDYKLNGLFVGGFSVRQSSGAYRFVNTAGDVYGTTGTGQNHGVSTNGAGAYNLTWRGLSDVSPMIVTGENGFQMPSSSAGSIIDIQNIIAKSPNASGYTANFGVSGTNYYGSLTTNLVRVFNSGQEGGYEGNTGASYDGTNYIQSSTTRNWFCYNLQRECVQREHVNVILIEYVTSWLAGQTATPGQRNNFQYHDNGPGGELRYCVFYAAQDGFSIASHGMHMHHNYISWTAFPGQILRTDNQYFATTTPPSPRLTGDSIIVEDNCLKKLGGSDTYAVKVEERTAPVIFRNNTVDGPTSMYLDNRVAGYTNTITGNIGDHGNVSGTCGPPLMWGSFSDPDNYKFHGLQTSASPYFDWGFRGKTHYP